MFQISDMEVAGKGLKNGLGRWGCGALGTDNPGSGWKNSLLPRMKDWEALGCPRYLSFLKTCFKNLTCLHVHP